MKVGFLVIGTQKGGTTALHRFLSEHPDISMPTDRKELHHFDAPDVDAPGALDRYHARFDPDRAIAGEATPIYMYWPGVIERIHAYNPDARLIAILRNPVDRAYSHYEMVRQLGVERLSFHHAIRVEPIRRWLLSSRRNPPGVHRRYSYVHRGFYAAQLRRVLEWFPADQLLVLRNEELAGHHTETLDRVCDFLGVSRMGHDRPERVYSHRYAPMDDADRRHLVDVYADDVAELESMFGWDCSDWLRTEIAG